MDAFRAYNRATATLLAGQAALLLVAPSMVVWMLSPDPRTVTSLETMLARSNAVALLTLSFLVLLFTGDLSFITSSTMDSTDTAESLSSPYASPTLFATTFYHTVTTIMLYTYSYSSVLSSGWLVVGCVAHFTLAASGVLLQLFGKDPGRISKRTGADKRTSNFPFTNAEAAKRKAR